MSSPETLPPSPFILGTLTQFAWDNTSLTWFMDCPRKYFYAMIEGWQSKGQNAHLIFGTEYHRALESYDKFRAHGMIHQESVHATVHEVLTRTAEWDSTHKTKNRDSLLRSVIWYLDEFENDAAQTLILANGKPAVELSFKIPLGDFTIGETQVLWCGHLDRVVSYAGETYVMDRKTTTASVGQYYFEGFDLDRQMTGYTYMGMVALGSPVKGVIIDAAAIGPAGTTFARGLTYRTQARMEEWLDNTSFWIYTATALSNRATLHGDLDEGSWPMNETSCNKYRSNDPTAQATGCAFKRICSADPSMRRHYLESGFERRSWNPLEAR